MFMRGFEGNTIIIGHQYNLTIDSKVSVLKQCIAERTGIRIAEILLIYTTKQLGEEAD